LRRKFSALEFVVVALLRSFDEFLPVNVEERLVRKRRVVAA